MPFLPSRRALMLCIAGVTAPVWPTAAPAHAQQWVAPAGAHGVASHAPTLGAPAPARRAGAIVTSRADGAANGALIGGLAGAVVAYLITRQPRISHDTDFVAYVVFIPAGALVGAIAGALTAGDEPAR